VSGDVDARAPWTVRLALSLVATSTAATALYAALRVAQALLFREANPATVLWSEHAAFFWRAWTAVYVGGMGGLLTFAASARSAPRVASLLARALPFAAALLGVQALLCP
jgi:hypothetical protein